MARLAVIHRDKVATALVLAFGLVLAFVLSSLAATAAPILGIGSYGLRVSGGAARWITVASYLVLAAPTLLVWRSRWNIVVVSQLSFFIAAYIVPVFATRELNGWPLPTLQMYYGILLLGALAIAAGTLAGYFAVCEIPRAQSSVRRLVARLSDDRVLRRVWIAACVTTLALAGCYVITGFIPILATDPDSAKYLAGAYTVDYKLAFVYHAAVSAASSCLLLTLGAYAASRQRRLALIAVVQLALLVGTDQRNNAFVSVVLFLLFLGAARRIPFVPIVVAALLITPFGSASAFVLTRAGLQQFAKQNQGTTVYTAIAAGAPDISDTLTSFSNYLQSPAPTHGLTFVGGLALRHDDFAPAFYSLRLANPGVPLFELTSGGERYPTPFWGYFAWGWWGAFLASLVAGLLVGGLVGLVRPLFASVTFLQALVVVALTVSVEELLLNYATIDWLHIFACLPALFVLWSRGPRSTEKTPERLLSAEA